MKRTKIAWTEATWNPVTGCTKCSAGCLNCYAERMAVRLKAMGLEKYKNGFAVTTHDDRLDEPLHWKGRRIVFVCSMGDLFHKDVPFEFIDEVVEVIRGTPQHTYQILTKRAERMAEYFKSRAVPKNAMLGVTVENRAAKARIGALKGIETDGVRFLSCEPLLEDVGGLDLDGIGWVIVGGESGRGARRMERAWIDGVRSQCAARGVPFFFKQWGAWGEDGVRRSARANGFLLDGEVAREWPRGLATARGGEYAVTAEKDFWASMEPRPFHLDLLPHEREDEW